MFKEITQMVISITIQSSSKVKNVEILVSSVYVSTTTPNFWIWNWNSKFCEGFVHTLQGRNALIVDLKTSKDFRSQKDGHEVWN